MRNLRQFASKLCRACPDSSWVRADPVADYPLRESGLERQRLQIL